MLFVKHCVLLSGYCVIVVFVCACLNVFVYVVCDLLGDIVQCGVRLNVLFVFVRAVF